MPPVAKKVAAPAAPAFDLFDLNKYSSGGGMPEGDYCIVAASICMYAFTKADGTKAGEERLGALIGFRPLDGKGDDKDQFYSLGSKAHESWAPSEDGKGIVAVAGGPGTSPNKSTNWAVFVQSLLDAGLPPGVLSDLGGLEGTWVHMKNVPEPSERKGFRVSTGEAEEVKKDRTIAIVSEIKEEGMPWAGSGGIIEAAAPATPAAKVNGKAPVAAKPAAKVAAKVAAPAAEAPDDDAIKTAAINGASATLEANPNGVAKLIFKTTTFKNVSNADGVEIARAVQDTYFNNDENMNGLLGELGYVLAGAQIKPAA